MHGVEYGSHFNHCPLPIYIDTIFLEDFRHRGMERLVDIEHRAVKVKNDRLNATTLEQLLQPVCATIRGPCHIKPTLHQII
ncbi:MAG: hypothetical protein RBG13Loki_2958 [Promethearchaeota archaeon CR_4]|nr:MAG: hypothetical protein RBG13Loki_2958 [Candidatus Lokiarchaeota archaeon CR_4]